MARVNYRSSGGEVQVVSFLDEEHWEEVNTRLTATGVDLETFCGTGGGVIELRRLARKKLHLDSTEWKSAVGALFDKVTDVSQLVEQAGYGFCAFGPAIVNPDYVAPVTKILESGYSQTTFDRINGNEFHFLRPSSLLNPGFPVRNLSQAKDLSIMLQWGR